MELTCQGLLGPLPSLTACVEAYLSSPTEQGERDSIVMMEINLTLDCEVGVDKALQGLLRHVARRNANLAQRLSLQP